MTHSTAGIDAYPLQWPDGWPRTRAHRRERSRFGTTQDKAQRQLMEEIRRMGGRQPVLSTNIRLRNDGLPYTSQRPPEDPGVAVYFRYRDSSMVFACDRWDRVQDNIHSIGKTIEALRGIKRWGASDMLERAFSGFTALPGPQQENWREVLQVGNSSDLAEAERNFRLLSSEHHPDKGGDGEQFQRLVKARDQARQALAV